MKQFEEIEKSMLALLKGEYSSLSLTFNDGPAPNYMSVKQWIEEGPSDQSDDWVSEDEKQRAIETNKMWNLHWYQDTPVGFYSVSASSLPALLEYVFSGKWKE